MYNARMNIHIATYENIKELVIVKLYRFQAETALIYLQNIYQDMVVSHII